MKTSFFVQALRIGIFLLIMGFLLYLVDRDQKQQGQIDYNIKRDSMYYAKSDSMLNEIYMMAVTNKTINTAQDSAIQALNERINR